jgi:uncharacterized protein (TIGR03435 family)
MIDSRSFRAATTMLVLATIYVVAAQREPQATFDVASLRPVVDSSHFPPLAMAPSGDLRGRNNLEGLIRWAYPVQGYEKVIGADASITTRLQEWYEVQAKPPVIAADRRRVDTMPMLQTMLAQRVGLRIRIDNELATVTVLRTLTPGAYGRALRPAPEGCKRLPPDAQPGNSKFADAYVQNCRLTYFDQRVRGTTTLDEFAYLMSFSAQRPIVNRTGLEGMFAFDLSIGRNAFPPPPCPGCGNARPDASEGPAFNDAMRDEMGFTARQERQPINVYVVEKLGPFIEN